MGVPSPAVYVQGQGSVSADQLNTFVQGGMLYADLRSFVGLSGMQASLIGGSSPADGDQGQFYWNASLSNPVDNGYSIIVPGGSAQGAWVRMPTSGLITSGIAPTVGVTTATPITIASIVAPPGTWDIYGFIYAFPAASTVLTSLAAYGSTVNAGSPNTWPDLNFFMAFSSYPTGTSTVAVPIGRTIQTFAVSTTIYLVANIGFTTSTLTASGVISAKAA
jgi:hypothetical protein